MNSDRPLKNNLWVATSALLLTLAACNGPNTDEGRRVGIDTFLDLSQNQKAVCGTLRLDFLEPHGSPREGFTSSSYQSTFRRDADYKGMEDNDIRGFLDGTFKEGWNQVSQVHLRLGRRGRNPAFGELELFRNLQRWDDLPLPTDTTIEDARIELSLESGPPFPVDIAVYAVNKDWEPGSGGINHDNNGPPADGEVWWVDAKYGQVPWSRPGAGHASDQDPQADTGAEPLAISRYAPAESASVSFSSARLTAYIDTRIGDADPILLLYKLTDVYEDSPGSVLEIWSANAGTDGSLRRPALHLRWHTGLPGVNVELPLALEPGRYRLAENVQTGGDSIAMATFTPDASLVHAPMSGPCGGQPFIEYRSSGSGERWRELTNLSVVAENAIDLRVSATIDPAPLGQPFTAEIRDTWVTEGAPESQPVLFEFQSPDVRTLSVNADYLGDFRWQATLTPDTPGHWAYRWRHTLSGKEMVGEWRQFDVVAWEHQQVMDGLKSLERAIVDSAATPRSQAMLPYELSFMRLQRAAMQLDGAPDGPESRARLELMRRIRELLGGKPVPSPLEPKPIKSRDSHEVVSGFTISRNLANHATMESSIIERRRRQGA